MEIIGNIIREYDEYELVHKFEPYPDYMIQLINYMYVDTNEFY